MQGSRLPLKHAATVKALSCFDPASYISWDSVHWTHEANRLLTQHILTGKYFEPSSPYLPSVISKPSESKKGGTDE